MIFKTHLETSESLSLKEALTTDKPIFPKVDREKKKLIPANTQAQPQKQI